MALNLPVRCGNSALGSPPCGRGPPSPQGPPPPPPPHWSPPHSRRTPWLLETVILQMDLQNVWGRDKDPLCPAPKPIWLLSAMLGCGMAGKLFSLCLARWRDRPAKLPLAHVAREPRPLSRVVSRPGFQARRPCYLPAGVPGASHLASPAPAIRKGPHHAKCPAQRPARGAAP